MKANKLSWGTALKGRRSRKWPHTSVYTWSASNRLCARAPRNSVARVVTDTSHLWTQLPVYRARPSALLPLWSGAAYALGACSALLGREAAYAVTEAVEDVITAHYNDQLRDLAEQGLSDEVALRRTFKAFRDDEQQHLEEAVRRDAHQAPAYSILSNVVKTGCKAAIWMAQRV
jgi:demethoxyubiquinone hydroxylase (CLK1/Coq7/Cat5 family)